MRQRYIPHCISIIKQIYHLLSEKDLQPTIKVCFLSALCKLNLTRVFSQALENMTFAVRTRLPEPAYNPALDIEDYFFEYPIYPHQPQSLKALCGNKIISLMESQQFHQAGDVAVLTPDLISYIFTQASFQKVVLSSEHLQWFR